MGNQFFKKQEASRSADETVGAENKPAEKSVTTQPEDSGATPKQEVAEPQKSDVVVQGSEEVTPSLPAEECTAHCTEAAAAALQSAPGDVAKEAPAPVLQVDTPSPPESAPAPEPVGVPQLSAEPKPEPDVEAVPEPISESVPAPAEPVAQETNLLPQESAPDPTLSSPPSVDPAIPDLTSQPDKASASSADVPAPVSPEAPSGVPAEECGAEAVVISASVLEKAAETSASLKPPEEEAAGNPEQLMSDVNVESISGQLKQLELSGSDLVADLIPSDVKMSDDLAVIDTSASTELM